MTEVIKFPSRKSPPAQGRAESSARARRNRRNPLRYLLQLTEAAVVELNKVDYQHTAKEMETVREGMVAAKVLADDLKWLGAQAGIYRINETQPESADDEKDQPDKAAEGGHSYVDFLRNFRAHFEQALANGKEVDRIFDDLEYGVAKRLGPVAGSPQKRAEDKTLAREMAFLDLEPQVCDLDRWGELAASLVGECVGATVETGPELQIAYVVVNHLREFVKSFKTNYYRAWEGPDGEVA